MGDPGVTISAAEFARLRRAADKQELYDLVVQYSRAIDRRDLELLRRIYHPDATDEHGSMFQGSIDDYITFLRPGLAHYDSTVHYVVQALFEVDGDYAEGEVHKINYHRTRGPDAMELVTGSRSHDRFERRDGVWGFTYRGITLDWCRTAKVNPADYETFPARSPHGKPDATDLSYARLRLFRRFDSAGS